MHFLQLFLPGVAAMSSHVSIPVWLLWHQIVESRSEYEGDTWRGILEGSYRPLARADEREEKGGCRVVVQGGGCCCGDCWRGKSGREKEIWAERLQREASGKSLGGELLFGCFWEEGLRRGSSRAGILEKGS